MGVTVERVADGRRRFFPTPGRAKSVFLRDKRGHHDRGLEPGRDYEVESGGVTLRRVPSAGEMVVIVTGERQKESGQATQKQVSPTALVPAERIVEKQVPVLVERVVEIPREVVVEKVVERLVPIEGDSQVREEQPPSAVSNRREPAADALDALKRALVVSIGETNNKIPGRSAEWQDELAKRTAVLWAAKTRDGVKSAMADVEAFLRGGIQ